MSTSSRTNGITAAVIAFTIALDIAALIYMHKRSCASIIAIEKSYEEELQKEKELREKERIGRISVQKKTRDRLTEQSLKLGYQYRPIGFVESPFPDRRGTPRQPVLVPAAIGKIRFEKTIIQFEHFKEIIQFSHIWVLFVFHENTNGDTEASQLPARIKPPRLGGLKVGCLTTRSPHRPNNIGLSVCEVVEVGSDYITISGIDMVDGTPVIDIKPYIPYDSIQLQTKDGEDTESVAPLPMSVAASFSNSNQPHDKTFKERRLTVPSWIIDSDIPLLPVNFEACALESLNELVVDRLLIHCTTKSHAIDLITQVLRQDIRGVHQGRGKVTSVGDKSTSNTPSASADQVGSSSSNQSADPKQHVYMCRLDSMHLDFVTTASEIRVLSIGLYTTQSAELPNLADVLT